MPILVSLSLVLGALFASTFAWAEGPSPAGPKIGAVLALTGPSSVTGREVRQGLELCLGAQVQMLVEDSQAQPAVGLSAFTKLANLDHIDLGVITFSGVSSAIIPVAANRNIPLILTVVSSRAVVPAGSHTVFRYFTSGEQEAPIMAEYLVRRRGVQTAAILSLEDEYGQSYQQAFRRALEQQGARVTASETFTRDTADFRPQLAKIKAGLPHAVYVVGHDGHIISMLKQAKELGIASLLASNWLLSSPTVRQGNEQFVDGALFTAPEYYFSESIAVRKFREEFNGRFQAEPTAYAAIGCDIARLVNQFGQKGVTDLVRELGGLRGYPGLMGNLDTSADGSIEFTLHPAVFEKGKVQRLEVASAL